MSESLREQGSLWPMRDKCYPIINRIVDNRIVDNTVDVICLRAAEAESGGNHEVSYGTLGKRGRFL